MNLLNRRRPSTLRLRLTVLYAGAFFLAGAILVALTYFYLQQSLEHRPGSDAGGVVQQFLDERGVRGRLPVLERVFTAIDEHAEQQRRDTLRGMLIWSLGSLGLIGVAAGGFGWLLAGRALAPLQHITATARRVAERSLHERIALDGPDDEIKDLADTFDAMLQRLDRAFDGQRRFVANASHELRTPLAINRTLIEVALDDPETPEATRRLASTLLDINDRSERLIDGLLVLASSEQQLDTRARVDLADITERTVRALTVAALRAGITVSTNLTSVYVAGDPTLLERLAHNLLDNAIRYNTPGQGWIRVTVTGDATSARLTVENTGPVIPPTDVDGLFEPFRRVAATDRIAETGHGAGGRGAGLGLSIVRAVATTHGGDATALARPDGGLIVTITLPISQ